eukprot:snap_masked-scaffold_23-processed-gene-3.17-mRNA-1 protein AED:0.05 eAED:0.05 QI:0/0/0/0.66/1/1/3/0/1013
MLSKKELIKSFEEFKSILRDKDMKKELLNVEVLSYFVVAILCAAMASADLVSAFHNDGWLVIGVVGFMFIALLNDRMPADFVMALSLAVVIATGIVTTEEGLAGFASSAVLAVAVLYGVAASVTATGALDYFMGKLLGNPKSLLGAQVRIMLPTALISGFMNNTPVVAILIPIIQNWSKKINNVRDDISSSQLFIPLSFASILGGTCTLIGTSTNLVVAGKAQDTVGIELSLFELGMFGVPVLFTGLTYIVLFSPWLLPSNEVLRKRNLIDSAPSKKSGAKLERRQSVILGDFSNEALFLSCLVNPESAVVNKTVKDGGLRQLKGRFLTSVQRRDQIFQAVSPEFVVHAFDVLHFSGVGLNFFEFCGNRGFTPITEENQNEVLSKAVNYAPEQPESAYVEPDGNFDDLNENKALHRVNSIYSDFELDPSIVSSKSSRLKVGTFDSRLVKAIVRSTGELPQKTTMESNFRTNYKAVIISIQRAKHTTQEKTFPGHQLGRFVFKAGDELELMLHDDFSWEDARIARDLKLAPSHSLSHTKSSRSSSGESADFTDKLESGSFGKKLEKGFWLSMRVADSSRLIGAKSLVGQTINSAGLRGLPGLFVIALERQGKFIHAVSSKEVLEKGDILWFIGEREAVSTLRRIPGLESPAHVSSQVQKLKLLNVERRLVECVISMTSDMLGKTIKEARFRSRFRAAIVAVHREGQRVLETIGDIELKAGDVLVLDTGPNFVQRFRNDPNFLLVAEIENSEVPQFAKFYLAMFGLAMMMLLTGAFDVSLVVSAVFCLALMCSFQLISTQRVRDSINWGVIVTIACAFGLSSALENSNVATTIGSGLVDLAELSGTGEVGILVAVYVATVVLSIVIANNAAALLMFPIALEAVNQYTGVSTDVFAAGEQDDDAYDLLVKVLYVLMLAASSSFSTPFGYQTNLMVYGPGNYLFKDFLMFGLPMQLWQAVFGVLFVYYADYWGLCWIISISGFAGICFLMHWKTMKTVDVAEVERGSYAESIIASSE